MKRLLAVLTFCLYVSGTSSFAQQPLGLASKTKSDPRLTRDKLITLSGTTMEMSPVDLGLSHLSGPGKLRVGDRNMNAVGLAVDANPPAQVGADAPGSTQWTLPDVDPPTPLSTDEISTSLSDLFRWSPAATKYGTYFLLLPGALTLKQNVAANVAAIPAGQVYPYQPYPMAAGTPGASVALKVQAMPTLQGAFPFLPANGDPSDAYFIYLDGFATKVPIPVVDTVEANFINGLVTRLILGDYAKALAAAGGAIKPNDLSFARLVATPGFADMTAPGLYPNGASFATDIQNMLLANPVQPAGLLWGWKAGDELDALSGADSKYKADVWKILKSRFSDRDMGQMVGFTLNYLTGFVKNDRIKAMAAGADPGKLDTNAILAKLSTDTGVTESKVLTDNLHSTLIAEFYALGQNTTLSAQKKTDLMARLATFIQGFQSGSTEAADSVYVQVFQLAYGLGYKDGFRDGYAAGYAAGYRDGYAVGYAQAWKEANVVIQKLQNELNEAKSHNSMWSTIGSIASVVGTVLSFL